MVCFAKKLQSLHATLLVLAFVIAGCASTGNSQDKPVMSVEDASKAWTDLERSSVNYADVNRSNVSAPLGRYLLVRDDDFLCALRFINFIRGQDERPSSFWTSGDETLTSVYEWTVIGEERTSLRVLASGKDVVKFTAPHGFGHLIVGGGYGSVKCGARKFGWQYPDGINLVPNGSRRIAPTPWQKIEDIRLDNPGLTWYSFDQSRKKKRIPLAELEQRFSIKK